MAARLCDHARNVDVLMPTVHLDSLPGGVNAEPYGDIELRGFPGEVDVVRLTGGPPAVAMSDAHDLSARDIV